VRYRRKAPLVALSDALDRYQKPTDPRRKYAWRDLHRVLLSKPKSRRRVNGRLVRLEVRP